MEADADHDDIPQQFEWLCLQRFSEEHSGEKLLTDYETGVAVRNICKTGGNMMVAQKKEKGLSIEAAAEQCGVGVPELKKQLGTKLGSTIPNVWKTVPEGHLGLLDEIKTEVEALPQAAEPLRLVSGFSISMVARKLALTELEVLQLCAKYGIDASDATAVLSSTDYETLQAAHSNSLNVVECVEPKREKGGKLAKKTPTELTKKKAESVGNLQEVAEDIAAGAAATTLDAIGREGAIAGAQEATVYLSTKAAVKAQILAEANKRAVAESIERVKEIQHFDINEHLTGLGVELPKDVLASVQAEVMPGMDSLQQMMQEVIDTAW